MLTLVVGPQWHWKGCDQPGEALPDVEILSMIREEMHRLYQKEGGRGIESFEAMTWNYAQPHSPSSVELAKELNGYALVDLSMLMATSCIKRSIT